MHICCRFEEGTIDADDHEKRLKTLTDSYKVGAGDAGGSIKCARRLQMTGQPLNMAYSSLQALLLTVRACQVHLNFNETAEFALAVHIHPYINNVLSVWVYIASLVPMRPINN